MNIKELFNLNGNVSVSISLADLNEFVEEKIVEAAAKPAQVKDDILMSASEVCEALGISANSLWRWGKTGYLRGSKVGRKTFYHKADIDRLLKGEGA